MNMKKVLLPLLLLALGIGGFMALKATRPKPPVAQAQEPVWRVKAVPVRVETASPVLNLNGKVESPDETQAAAPGVGRVLVVRVREGQAVAKGQLLLELDPRDFLPRVEQARGQVRELEAAIASEHLRHQADLDQLAQERRLQDFAAADVDRFERLQKENFYSQAAVEQSRSNLSRQQISVRGRELAIADHKARLAQLQARLVQANASLDQADLAYQRSRVVAPFPGHVAQVAVAAGDQVNTGQALVKMYPSAGLEVRAKLPAPLQDEFLATLRQGEHAQAYARMGDAVLSFRLARVAGAADARGLDGFFVLARGAAVLRVGELVSLNVVRAPLVGVVSVPYGALFGGNRVYRIEGDRLNAVNVEVLGEAASNEVVSGEPAQAGQPARLLVRAAALKDGERLLATHLPNAVTGLKVEVIK
ncbi:MAG: biotin/lipoyl-binding protein [Thiobacillus sp.]|nr:biotin/lipoyl-binding protein [Thiobacillus sp.]